MKIRKALLTIATIGVLTTTLAGCFPQALPDEQRYGNIDAVLEHLDPETAGEVVGRERDAGDGIMSTSLKTVFVSGPNVAQIIDDRLSALPNLTCSNRRPGNADCDNKLVLIRITFYDGDKEQVRIEVQDPSNGHKTLTPTPNGQ